ncbi:MULTISPECIES: hypothetical protein [Lacticaseibacillus]|uniref:Uncharacterized protein n=1 Tax=Lacticaseibacillus zeae DSM 20178 = KCTC 3804 TaxID=1423816 RepID=A0A0R1ER89_LACZE|nr:MULTISPECIES: hypothetical protein [Lacticaseibacillus]KRK11848.1 hypothetical protein FD51_GL000834 [Lacticaseibacillus zeae DSM 20178 = KCTC 3804]MDE3295926.1 hypothetical protein [Lacticaseibacillus rhamnosus]DAL97618.1 MAG TPA: hypothetical protein [Caudoviricetes sp.]DAZ12205.1 MAG TPA: hypothetical protein [Caudoviricetes sp.]
MLSIISILISLASFGFSLWTWKSQGKKAKYMNLEFITFANHAVFSYNSKRPNSENLFMLGPSIEIDLDVLNPSSLPLTIYGFQLIAHGSDKYFGFQLLTQETLAGDMVKERLAGGASEENMRSGILNVIRLIPNDIVIVKPYSTYRLTTIFQGKVNMPDTFTDFQFRFRVVSKNPFGNGFEDQIYRLDISDYPELSRRTLDPGKLVPKIVLHQIDSAL